MLRVFCIWQAASFTANVKKLKVYLYFKLEEVSCVFQWSMLYLLDLNDQS